MRKRSKRSKPWACPATTGNTYQISGKQDFPCQRTDPGHTEHEHHSALLDVIWVELPGGGRRTIMGRAG